MIASFPFSVPATRLLKRLAVFVTVITALNVTPELFAAANSPIDSSEANSSKVSGRSPKTPRELFNAGTQNLRAKQFSEAESYLESVLASQTQQFEPPALYNLGHVRFSQG